jgi:hypothetical protein
MNGAASLLAVKPQETQPGDAQVLRANRPAYTWNRIISCLSVDDGNEARAAEQGCRLTHVDDWLGSGDTVAQDDLIEKIKEKPKWTNQQP